MDQLTDIRSDCSTTISCDRSWRDSDCFLEEKESEEISRPSKEQRWCVNCNKCYRLVLSHYDHFCGLNRKTAHTMRQLR